jgi:hypothetical protein
MYSRAQSLFLVVMSLTSEGATGQDAQPPAKDQRQRWMNLYSEEAAKYQMFRRGDDEEELELVPSPILAYTNPVRVRDTHGAAFVWTSDGRPEVVGAVWSVISQDDATKRHISQEFHSLSLVPIHSKHEPRASQRGLVPDWATGEPGIEPKRIPNAQAPVQMPNLRLTQMRRLARRFEATFPPGLSDGQGSFRLLAQPVYRYRSKSHRIIDGAIFAFVMGTDPELILVIEAVESGGGQEWRFAAAPLTNLPMRLDYQDTRIWECPRPVPYVGDRPHFLYYHVSVRDRVIE